MSKTIVLIYPRPTQGYAKERRRDIHAVKRIYAPLSIMYLAATLEEAGFNVLLLDHRLISLDEMKDKVAKLGDILFFGISTMTGSQIRDGIEIARELRAIYGEEVPLIWGGVHPTIFPEKTITHPLVDVIVYGEGDYTIVELARAIAGGSPLDAVKGICFKRNGGMVKTASNDKIKSLDTLPIPAWGHLKEFLNSAQYPILATITTSRGCPYSCSYCYKGGLDSIGAGSLWRSFGVDRVMKEVHYLNSNFGFDIFEMSDENFILQPKRALQLIRNFKSHGYRISAVRSNFLTYKDEIIDELKGFCDYVAYSPETGSPRIQALLNKGADYQKMKILNAKLRDMGIDTIHTFIFGFPFETDDDVRATVELCKSFKRINPACRMSIYQYMPYPGAPLTEMMISQYGLVLPEDFAEWSRTDMYGDLDMKFRPWVSPEKLKFLCGFQTLFNILFNTYEPLGKEVSDIYYSDPKIGELLGDIWAIPRFTKHTVRYKLNDRLTPELLGRYADRVFV